MTITRRSLLNLSLSALVFSKYGGALAAGQQGVSSHKTAAEPRMAPSGRPFHAHFVDVAEHAGLVAETIYGDAHHKDYILETVGCGCAFIDYDNDGWIDIFILGGSRMSGELPATSNRLYKNNRDGTFTDVTEKAGLRYTGWGSGVCVGDYNNDGFEDLFCTFYGQNKLYRNNGDGTFTDMTKAAGWRTHPPAGVRVVLLSTTTAMATLTCLSPITFSSIPSMFRNLAENSYCNYKGVPVNCGPRGLPPGFTPSIATTAMGHLRMSVSRQA